jgi:hypothetical protein
VLAGNVKQLQGTCWDENLKETQHMQLTMGQTTYDLKPWSSIGHYVQAQI